jgi:Flp pilus assembly protein TadD
MAKSTLSSLMAVILLIALAAQPRVTIAEGYDWAAHVAAEAAAQAEEDETTQETAETPKKKSGNRVARALGAPFRALGRLFGGGNSGNSGNSKKNGPASARKISEKDAATFESAKISRVKDARVDDSASTPPVIANQPADVHLRNGRQLLSAGKVNEAIAELTAAQSVDPKSAEIQNLLGVAYGSKGMSDRALKAFEAAVRADKNNAQYLNNYGFLLLQTSNFEGALKHLKRAAKLSPNDARIWNNLAIAQCQRGKFEEAYQSFVRAVGEYDGRVNMAAQLLAQAQGQEAIKHLEAAHSLRPESIEVLTRLAGLYRMTGRITDAETARRSLLALQTSAAAQK